MLRLVCMSRRRYCETIHSHSVYFCSQVEHWSGIFSLPRAIDRAHSPSTQNCLVGDRIGTFADAGSEYHAEPIRYAPNTTTMRTIAEPIESCGTEDSLLKSHE